MYQKRKEGEVTVKDMALGHSSGFMSIRLLAVGVIVVSFVVAVLVVENVIGGFFERASVTICFENPDIDWPPPESAGTYEEAMFFGDVLVQCPKSIDIHDSVSVDLTLRSRDYAVSESDVDGNSTDEGTYYVMGEDVELYPVMRAELKGVNFDIADSEISQAKVVLPGSSTTWTWIISPNTVGKQALTVELSSRVRVEVPGLEDEAARSVYLRKLDISVSEPFNLRDFLERTETMGAIIGTFVGIGGAAFGLWRKRQKKQKAKLYTR